MILVVLGIIIMIVVVLIHRELLRLGAVVLDHEKLLFGLSCSRKTLPLAQFQQRDVCLFSNNSHIETHTNAVNTR